MSKQDIEKRLGFAAQGVKETTRSSAKAKMAKRMIVDTITSGNQKHELGYESVMQSLTAGEPPHEWFRPIVRTTNLDTGKSSEKASQPHYTEKSARDWLKNYASSVKPSTDPLYAEYASNREKISKMMTRLAQARNNPELRQKLQAESDKLDARQREVAAQLQKRKSSRTGVKANMSKATDALAFIKSSIESGKTVYIQTPLRATKVTPKTYAAWEASGRPLFKIGKDGALLMASGSSYNRLTMGENEMLVRVSAMSRPGVKAKFEKEYVLWGLPKGETDRLHEKVLSTQAKTPAQMEDVKKRASAAGWHSFRVQILDLSKPYKGFARPTAKAKA